MRAWALTLRDIPPTAFVIDCRNKDVVGGCDWSAAALKWGEKIKAKEEVATGQNHTRLSVKDNQQTPVRKLQP